MVLPLIAGGIGAAMSLPTIAQGIQDLMDDGLSDEQIEARTSQLQSQMRSYAQEQIALGRDPADVEAEVMGFLERESSKLQDQRDTEDITPMQLALTAASLVPGVGAARMGASGLKAAYGAGRGVAQAAGKGALRQALGGVDEVLRTAGTAGLRSSSDDLARIAALQSRGADMGRIRRMGGALSG